MDAVMSLDSADLPLSLDDSTHQSSSLNPSSSSLLSSSNRSIDLISSTGQRFPISHSALNMSEFARSTLEGDESATELHLYHIDSQTVELIISYMTHHMTIPPRRIDTPLQSSNLNDLVSRWDYEFIQRQSERQLFKTLLAANYMNIRPLLILTTASVASQLKGKTPNEICKHFNIRTDMTQEEEAEIRREYKDLID